MRISDWSSDVCSSDLEGVECFRAYDADLPEYAAAIDVYPEADDRDTTWLHVQEYAAPAQIPEADVRRRFGEVLAAAREVFGVPRSDERRVGKECVSTCRARWSRYDYKTNKESQDHTMHAICSGSLKPERTSVREYKIRATVLL